MMLSFPVLLKKITYQASIQKTSDNHSLGKHPELERSRLSSALSMSNFSAMMRMFATALSAALITGKTGKCAEGGISFSKCGGLL